VHRGSRGGVPVETAPARPPPRASFAPARGGGVRGSCPVTRPDPVHAPVCDSTGTVCNRTKWAPGEAAPGTRLSSSWGGCCCAQASSCMLRARSMERARVDPSCRVHGCVGADTRRASRRRRRRPSQGSRPPGDVTAHPLRYPAHPLCYPTHPLCPPTHPRCPHGTPTPRPRLAAPPHAGELQPREVRHPGAPGVRWVGRRPTLRARARARRRRGDADARGASAAGATAASADERGAG
jgi:hypothetical protein